MTVYLVRIKRDGKWQPVDIATLTELEVNEFAKDNPTDGWLWANALIKLIREQKPELLLKFFVTFGQKYRHEPHPQQMHPDGWVEVLAVSYTEARTKVNRVCSDKWAFMYDEQEFEASRHLYPQGCLGTII